MRGVLLCGCVRVWGAGVGVIRSWWLRWQWCAVSHCRISGSMPVLSLLGLCLSFPRTQAVYTFLFLDGSYRGWVRLLHTLRINVHAWTARIESRSVPRHARDILSVPNRSDIPIVTDFSISTLYDFRPLSLFPSRAVSIR